MGGSYPKPEIGEGPKDWMYRCGWGYYTNPWLDNLAGWTEAQAMRPYPRDGSFDPHVLKRAHKLIYESEGDPEWDHDYMKKGYEIWMKMMSVWNDKQNINLPKGVKKLIPKPLKGSASKIEVKRKETPKVPPAPVVTVPSVTVTVPTPTLSSHPPDEGQGKAQQRMPLYPVQELEGLRTEKPDQGDNQAFLWVSKKGGHAEVTPPSATQLKDVISLLPDMSRPVEFVETMIRVSRNAQLTGADYKFILMNKMGSQYDETALIDAVPCLCSKNDEVKLQPQQMIRRVKIKEGDYEEQEYTKDVPYFYWRDEQGAIDILKRQLTAYLVDTRCAHRDLSHVTSCKQEKKETVSAFLQRFSNAWIHLGGFDLPERQPQPLFISTFISNCTPDVQKILKF